MRFDFDEDLSALQRRAQQRAAKEALGSAVQAAAAAAVVRRWLTSDLWGTRDRDALGASVVIAELARVSPWGSLSLGAHIASHAVLTALATSARHQKVLESSATGEKVLCFGSADADDPTSPIAAPLPTGDFSLDGVASAVTNAQVADYILVAAPLNGSGHHAAFLLEMASLKHDPVASPHALRAHVHLSTRVKHEDRLVTPDTGTAAESHAGWFRLTAAATSVGVARTALAKAIDAGRALGARLGQAAQFSLSDSATEVEAAELMLLRAADAVARSDEARLETASAKLFCTAAASRAVHRALTLSPHTDPELEALYLASSFLETYGSPVDGDRDAVARKMLQE